MIKRTLTASAAVLLVSGCAPQYTVSPPDAGSSPDPEALLRTMSTRLTSSGQYRFTATTTIPQSMAEQLNKQRVAEIEILVKRPDWMAARISEKGGGREMIYDGRIFTVVDLANNFYSKAPLAGSLDDAAGQIAKTYGFQPQLAEFILSDPCRDLRHRVTGLTCLGKGIVRKSGKSVAGHRIGIQGGLAGAELWLSVSDSLPQRLVATAKNSPGSEPLADVAFNSWDLTAQIDSAAFRHQPAAGAEEIPMIKVPSVNAIHR